MPAFSTRIAPKKLFCFSVCEAITKQMESPHSPVQNGIISMCMSSISHVVCQFRNQSIAVVDIFRKIVHCAHLVRQGMNGFLSKNDFNE